MTSLQSFVGAVFELTVVIIFMSCFHSAYRDWKRIPAVALPVALLITALESISFPVMLRYAIYYSVAILLCNIVFRRNIKNTVFEFVIANLAVCAMEFALISLQTMMKPGELSFANRMLHVGIILFTAIAVARNRKLTIRLRAFYEKYAQTVFLIATNIIAAFILILFLWDTNSKAVYESIGFLAVFVLLWMAVNLYMLRIAVQESKSKTAIQAYRKYAETTEALADNLYAEKHEYNKHLQAVLNLCDTGNSEKSVQSIKEYITELKNKRAQTKSEFSSVHIKDKLIAGMIYAKKQDAAHSGITLHCREIGEDPELPFLKYEAVEVIENLLDNAMEYLKELDASHEKNIYLELGTYNAQPYIKIKNDYYGQESAATDVTRKGYSSKQGERRGYGLYNVKQIILKYKGTLNIFIKDNLWNMEIRFANSEKQSGSHEKAEEV